MQPLNLIEATFLVLAAMVFTRSAVHSAPLENLDSDKNYITSSMRSLLRGRVLYTGAKDEYVEFEGDDIEIMSGLFFPWMCKFRDLVVNDDKFKSSPPKISDFEQFGAFWLEFKKIQLPNEAAHPVIPRLKRFMASPATTQLGQRALEICKSHAKMEELLIKLMPMVRKGISEPHEKLLPLLIEARSALEGADQINWIIDPAPSKLNRILETQELQVINKFISEDSR